ncbi:helix-turn-helix transcriptional regulator, partial [Kitasatospora sp. NPDC058263]
MTDQLGTLLRRLRGQAGLTQEQVAERSGVSVRTIRRLESGRSSDHRLGTVNLLADALDISAEDRRQLASSLAEARGASAPAVPRPAPAPLEPAPAPPGGPAAETPAPGPSAPPETPETPETPAPPPPPAPRPLPGALADAAQELAGEVRRRWRREEA